MTNPTDPAFNSGIYTEEGLPFLRKGETIGLTKREYFAAMAIGNFALGHLSSTSTIYQSVAEDCVRYADALISALNKEPNVP